jgi:HK97 family phage prohead protease
MTEATILPMELRRAGDHTLEGLCIPYGVTTMKAGYPKGERFLPGAFSEVVSGRSKIRLTDSHDETGKRPIGVATELRETPDGLFGTFRFYNTPEGRGAWENVVEETYGGLSVGFVPVAEGRASDGAREVSRARLFHVSLVDEPAYDDARILAVRAAVPDDVVALLAIEYRAEDFPPEVDLSRLVWGS